LAGFEAFSVLLDLAEYQGMVWLGKGLFVLSEASPDAVKKACMKECLSLVCGL
jgi:hypothetical protein